MDDLKAKTSDEPETALRRYDMVLRQFASESQTFWMRANFFLLANTALVGFALNQIPTGQTPPAWPAWNKLGSLVVISAIGLALTILWRAAIETGQQLIQHWREVARDLESAAFGDIVVVREWTLKHPTPPRSRSTIQLARWLNVVFAVVWSLSLAYLAFLGWAKFIGWAPALSN